MYRDRDMWSTPTCSVYIVFSPGDEVAEAALAVELELLAHYGGEG
jgi:hypothetical protein